MAGDRGSAANAYERPDRYIIITGSTAALGGWVDDGQPVVVERNADDERLGLALLDALSATRHAIPEPDRATERDISMRLKAAGVRTESAFLRETRHVRVRLIGDELTMRPSRNEGPRRGFFYLKSTITVHSLAPVKLGQYLRESFENCI
jgi:hypothetical protein